eukprot:3552142-Amphidinium_carterae.1
MFCRTSLSLDGPQRKQFRPPMPFKTKEKQEVPRASVFTKMLENEQNDNFLVCCEQKTRRSSSNAGASVTLMPR